MAESHEGDGFSKVDPETLRKFGAGAGSGQGAKANGFDKNVGWDEPFMGVLELRRRRPPIFPTGVFGETWTLWLLEAARAAACPIDYVAMPLLASASVLIGARWAQASLGWVEPPHLWCGNVGDSGDGKTPGANCLLSQLQNSGGCNCVPARSDSR